MKNSMNVSMKKLPVLCVAVALAVGSTAVFAQAQQVAPDRATPFMKQLDVNKDGVIDRAEAAKAPKLTERFDQLDANKDGKLSVDERPQMGGKHRRGAMHRGHGRMRAADTDQDGRISRAEMQAAQARKAEHFDKLDANQDGYVDRADMQARVAQRRAEFFIGADANRDGRVTRDEFIVEHGARSAERRARRAQRAQAAGKQMRVGQASTEQQQIEFTGKAFDRMDANKDGALTRAEFAAFKPKGHGMHHGRGHGMGNAKVLAPKP